MVMMNDNTENLNREVEAIKKRTNGNFKTENFNN